LRFLLILSDGPGDCKICRNSRVRGYDEADCVRTIASRGYEPRVISVIRQATLDVSYDDGGREEANCVRIR